MDHAQLKAIIHNAPTFLMFNNMAEEFESLTSKRFSEGEVIWSLWTFFHKIRVSLFSIYNVLNVLHLDLSDCYAIYPDFEKNFKLALEHITLPTIFFPRTQTQNPILLFTETSKHFHLEFVFTNIVNLSILTKVMNGLAKPYGTEENKTKMDRDLTLVEFICEVEAYLEEINIGLEILKNRLFLADSEEFFSLTWGIEIFDVYAENNNLLTYLHKDDALVDKILAYEDAALDGEWLKKETEKHYYEMLISAMSVYFTCKNGIALQNLIVFPGAIDLEITEFLDNYIKKNSISKRKDKKIIDQNMDVRMVSRIITTIQEYADKNEINAAIKHARDLYYNLMRIINSTFFMLRNSFEEKLIYSDDAMRLLSTKLSPARNVPRPVQVKVRNVKKEEKTQEVDNQARTAKTVSRYRQSRKDVEEKAAVAAAAALVTIGTQSPLAGPGPTAPTKAVLSPVFVPDPRRAMQADLEKFNQKLAELNKLKEQYDAITGKIITLLKIMKDFEKPKAKLQQIQTSYKTEVLNKVSSLNGEAKSIADATPDELKSRLKRLLATIPDMDRFLSKVTVLYAPLKAKADRGNTVNKNDALTQTIQASMASKAQSKTEEKEQKIMRRASDNIPRSVQVNREVTPLLVRRASDNGVRMQSTQPEEKPRLVVREAADPVVEEKVKSSLNPDAPEFVPGFLRSPSATSQPFDSLPNTPLAHPIFTRSQSDPIRHFSEEAAISLTVNTPQPKVTELNEESDDDNEFLQSIINVSLAGAEESLEQEDKLDFHVDSDADDALLAIMDASMADTQEGSTNEDKFELSDDDIVNLAKPVPTSTDIIRFSIFNTSLFNVHIEKGEDPGSELNVDPWQETDPLMQNKW